MMSGVMGEECDEWNVSGVMGDEWSDGGGV